MVINNLNNIHKYYQEKGGDLDFKDFSIYFVKWLNYLHSVSTFNNVDDIPVEVKKGVFKYVSFDRIMKKIQKL